MKLPLDDSSLEKPGRTKQIASYQVNFIFTRVLSRNETWLAAIGVSRNVSSGLSKAPTDKVFIIGVDIICPCAPLTCICRSGWLGDNPYRGSKMPEDCGISIVTTVFGIIIASTCKTKRSSASCHSPFEKIGLKDAYPDASYENDLKVNFLRSAPPNVGNRTRTMSPGIRGIVTEKLNVILLLWNALGGSNRKLEKSKAPTPCVRLIVSHGTLPCGEIICTSNAGSFVNIPVAGI